MLTALPQQHIFRRTNTPLNIPANGSPRPRTSDGGNAQREDKQQQREQRPTPPVQNVLSRTDPLESTAPTNKDLRKGVKAVSFISRLMGGSKKKDVEEDAMDDEASTSEERPEGNDAELFTQKVDNMGFQPRHPQPPAYIKVRGKYKKDRDFDRLFLAQELDPNKGPRMERRGSANKLQRRNSANPNEGNPIWAMEFSRDGKYLAAAGADMIVRVWAVLGSSEDRQKHERQESNESQANGIDAHAQHLSAPVFQSQPLREYEGHASTILDLSWSKNNFLLSSSMDKTVRLWHVSRSECLCTFKHNDFVPSICFHPKDDRFFLAGSLDSRLRLWSIPDKSVAYAAQIPDMITAVAFTPDGKFAMAGCLSGLCMFYETEGLKYQTQIHVRSTRGQNAKGSKITGIQAQYGPSGDIKVLITSNDSRVRLYNFRDKSLELKFKGNENNFSQIRAMFSDDGRYVVCGSEDRKAYIWSLHQSSGEKRDRTPMETFDAHDSITTAVCIAPTKTRQHLSKSEDPLYDLCNPPPITLLSHAERAESQASTRPPTLYGSERGSIQATPADLEGKFERPKETPAYVARTAHKEGNIIVTADYAGKIKVFRQDCAWAKRNRDDADKASLFSKRGSKASRNASVATRRSEKNLRDTSRSSISPQAPSDRILSWRQGIASTPSIAESRNGYSKDTSRSMSPRKSLDQRGRSANTYPPAKASSVRSSHPLAADSLVRSPSPIKRDAVAGAQHGSPDSPRSSIHKDSEEKDNALNLQGGRSYMFWDTDVWKNHAERIHNMAQEHEHGNVPHDSRDGSAKDGDHLAVQPNLHKIPSYVSELSDEHSSVEEFDDAREEVEMKCSRCGSLSFSGRKEKDGGMRLVCMKCGNPAS